MCAAYRLARERGVPLVSLVATGGSRMQEGMVALAQLQRVARESVLLREAGVPHVSVLRDPATGGGWATVGSGADVVLALPGAQIGFAGARVRPADADPAAYTAEGQLAAGHVDAVVPAGELRATLGNWLTALTRPAPGPVPPPTVPESTGGLPGSGWDAVRRARDPARPRAGAYLEAYFDRLLPLAGDRCGGTDPGMLCGVGLRGGYGVVYAAQCGTPTRPAGYRTAARVIRLADRLGLPVLTLVDTPGAANDAEAERAGAGAAVAEAFAAVAGARVPVTTLVVGEGGSGGALALAAAGNTWVTRDGYFSVIAPEAAAAILKRPPEEAPRTAGQLRLRPQDLVELGSCAASCEAPDRRDGASRLLYRESSTLAYSVVHPGVAVSRTVIDLDDEALEAAAKELGTTTKRDTINTALREVTARYRRLRALEDARRPVADGALTSTSS